MTDQGILARGGRDGGASGLLTSREAAAYLAVSTSTLSRWRTNHEGPDFINLGILKSPIPRYEKVDLDEWISRQKVKAR